MKYRVYFQQDEDGVFVATCPGCLTIPAHRELAKGTLRTLIKEAGLTIEEFMALL